MYKVKLFRLCFCSLALIWLFILCGTDVLGQPMIQFEETDFDWGRIKQGERVEHTFRFRNVGDRTLEIGKVSTSCGCTAALASESMIEPEKWGEIKATFNSGGRKGKQHKSIHVKTNDPDRESVKLTIGGEIIVLIRVIPRSLNFGELHKGKGKTMTVQLIPWGDTDFKILEIESTNENFEVKVASVPGIAAVWKTALVSARTGLVRKFGSDVAKTQLIADSKTTEQLIGREEDAITISVTLLPTAPLGAHTGKAKIHTNLEEKPVVEVSVYANVIGHIDLEPKTHHFGAVQIGETKETTYVISSTRGKIFRIKSIDNSSQHTSAEVEEVEPGTKYQLKVSLLPGAPAGKLQGVVILHTTDADQPEISAKYYADVKDGK